MTATALIDHKRLVKITVLHQGAHKNFSAGVCAMEAASYIAGEPWSDHPDCVCPVIGAFMRDWNDNLPTDEDRTRLLLPLIPQIIGTKGSMELEGRRATMAADWYVRTFTPAWLRLAGLTAHADTLAGFPEITSFERTPSIRPALQAASKDASAAWSAALSAAWSASASAVKSAVKSAVESAVKSAVKSAAWSAAESAAWSAVKSTAWSASASAAWSASASAAWSAAWSASASESAAWSALSETTVQLQESAVALIERMAKAAVAA